MIQKITEYFANIKKRNLYAKDIYNKIQSIYNNRKGIKIPIVVWSDNIHFQYNANLLKAYEYCAFFSPDLPPYWLSIEDANKKLNIIKNPLENQAIRINKIFDYVYYLEQGKVLEVCDGLENRTSSKKIEHFLQ